jgi:hypothetical protein
MFSSEKFCFSYREIIMRNRGMEGGCNERLEYMQSFHILLHLSLSWKLHLLSHVLVNEASLQLLFADNS